MSGAARPCLGIVSALLAVVTLAVRPVAGAPLPSERPNIVVILVDTLRADRTQPYGARRETTPFLQTLAEQSVVFTHAVSNATWTRSALPTILTSLSPLVHGKVLGGAEVVAGERFVERLGDEFVTLPELLKQAGYDTAAVVTWDGDAGFYAEEFGFRQGFNYVNAPSTLAGPWRHLVGLRDIDERIVRHALEWVGGRSGRTAPLFLYVHLFGAHGPFEPPRAYEGLFTPPDLLAAMRAAYKNSHGIPYALLSRKGEELDYVTTQYDANLRFVDDQLKALVTGLEQRLSPDTVYVILADHGEAFFEQRGQYLHGDGNFPYGPVTNIPLVFYAPGRFARRRVPEPVSQLDVLPTLVDLAQGAPPADIEGRSLVPLLEGAAPWAPRTIPLHPGVLVFAEASLFAGKKYLYLNPHNVLGSTRAFERFEALGEGVYDLEADPDEHFNALFYHQKFARQMRRATEAHYLSRMFGWHLAFHAGRRGRRVSGVVRADVPVYRMNVRYVGAEAIDVRRAFARNLLRKSRHVSPETPFGERLIGAFRPAECPRGEEWAGTYDVALPRRSAGRVFVFGVHVRAAAKDGAVMMTVSDPGGEDLRQVRVAALDAGDGTWLWNRFVPGENLRAVRLRLICTGASDGSMRLERLFFAREPLQVTARGDDVNAFAFAGEATEGTIAVNFATRSIPSTLTLEATVDGVPIDASQLLVFDGRRFTPAPGTTVDRHRLERAHVPAGLRPSEHLGVADRFYLYSAGATRAETAPMRPETIDMLKALGYLDDR